MDLVALCRDRPVAGPVVASALMRAIPEDFQVRELPAFAPSGEGEHLLIRVRKRLANTEWVARELAHWARTPRAAIGYAGRKDRHALAEQWFSIHQPGQPEPDPAALATCEFELLDMVRHHRKLRRGALRGNAFCITLREVAGPREAIDAALYALGGTGFANYYGPQRFGAGGANLTPWLGHGRGRRRSRGERAMQLSAARSLLFNRVLAARVRAGSWNRGLPGEVLALDGSQRWFCCQSALDDQLRRRVEELDLHPTGPLWGHGEPLGAGIVAALERAELEPFAALRTSLERAGMKQERRALRARANGLLWRWLGPTSVQLSFDLARGCFATSLLATVFELREGAAKRCADPSAGT